MLATRKMVLNKCGKAVKLETPLKVNFIFITIKTNFILFTYSFMEYLLFPALNNIIWQMRLSKAQLISFAM